MGSKNSKFLAAGVTIALLVLTLIFVGHQRKRSGDTSSQTPDPTQAQIPTGTGGIAVAPDSPDAEMAAKEKELAADRAVASVGVPVRMDGAGSASPSLAPTSPGLPALP